MKRKFLLMLLAATCSAAVYAQTYTDALKYSENTYYGTARSISMGDAFTALGGDLGSVTINPAGSAVNGFSQVSITGNVSIAGTSASYDASTGKYGSAYDNRKARFTMPNIGGVINFKTGRTRGLKNVTFGFVGNATANYLDNMSSGGTNRATSFAGAVAAGSDGYSANSMISSGTYDPYYDYSAPWLTIAGYQSGITATYDEAGSKFIGATEKLYDDGSIGLADTEKGLYQLYGRQASGYKYDMAFNLGFNMSDIVYFGFNLGVMSFGYSMDEYFKEKAVDPNNFGIDFETDNGTVSTCFSSLRYRYNYDASGNGVYGKFGIIAKPVAGLRIGAAIQTPTAVGITENWQLAAESHYTNSSFDASSKSPKGDYSYRLRSPYRANFGVAYTFGTYGLISADYELCDYSTMKFKEKDSNDNSAFASTNADIKDYTGVSHMLRLGVEFKPVEAFAIRAGYNLTTSAERYLETRDGNAVYTGYDGFGRIYTDAEGHTLDASEVCKKAPKANRHAFSFGLGYSSKGSFYCDLAYRFTKYPTEYVYPYSDYIENTASPHIKNKTHFSDIVATVGFRF